MFRLLALITLLFLPLVSAQADDEACSQAIPCEWIVDLDAGGFDAGLDGAVYNGTVGDWYIFSILNADDAEHTLTWDSYGLSWTIAAADVAETAPFELTAEGTFTLADAPSGDAATINVFLGDVVDEEAGSGSMAGPEQTQPSVGFAILGLVLLGLVAFARR